MTKTRVPLHKKSAGQNTAVRASIPVTSMSEIAMDSSNVKLECVSNPAEGSGSRVDLSATVSCQESSINTFTSSDSAAVLSVGNGGIERRLAGVHGNVADPMSFVVNCGTVENTVGSLSDVIASRQIHQASVTHNTTNHELMTDGPKVPLATVAHHKKTGGIASLMQMPSMTEQVRPVESARHCGSLVQIRVFSTELANCAADSILSGNYDSIIDFHRDYCAGPASQNLRNTGGYIPATQSHMNRSSEYHPSHPRDPSSDVHEPSVGYAQGGVEQWVRQQNASRQKQEQMAVSSVYAGQVYRSYDQIAEPGHYYYWSKPVSSVDLSRADMSSSVDFVGPPRYGSTDAAMNVRYHQDNCRMPDASLTLEQRQQRQSKIGRLQVIRQMLTAEQQVPMSDERMSGASLPQRQLAPSVGWNSVPCDDDMYAGHYSKGSQMMNVNDASSGPRRQCYAPSWDMMTAAQRKWYHIQHGYHMNQMGMQDNSYSCQPTDFHNSNVKYFEPQDPLHSPDQHCQLSGRDRVMPVHAVCDCSAVYPLCDRQACTCEGGMTKHYMMRSGMYGYTDVGMRQNYGFQQQVNRCGEFVNDKYCMPVGGGRQLTYNMPCKDQRSDGFQNWNSGENVMKEQFVAVSVPQKFDVQSQQVTLTSQLNNPYRSDRNAAVEPMNSMVSCVPAQIPAAAVRQTQPSSSKRRKNNSSLSTPSDSKSRKLDSGASEWSSSTRSGALMNITSASLAHLAKGVENMSAVMQQTLQQGGPFQSVRGSHCHADGSDENANFIAAASNSLQIPAVDVSRLVDDKTAPTSDCSSGASPLSALQTSGIYSRCSLATLDHVHSNASTAGIDVVVMPKAPYTISYRPTGISSEHDSQDNVDVRNASEAAFSHDARMQQQSDVVWQMTDVDTASVGYRRFCTHAVNQQELCGMTCHKTAAEAAKVDQQAAATDAAWSMASSVAVIQPQMMSGTQLFIADCGSQSAPVLNNVVLPTAMQFRSPQRSHSVHSDPNYQGFAVQNVPVSRDASNIPVFTSPNTVCTSDS